MTSRLPDGVRFVSGLCGGVLVALSAPMLGSPAAIPPLGPLPAHGLHFTDAVRTWDEAVPLGNGMMGALVWGDGHPLKISLDRADLWDLTPVPEFEGPDYRWATMVAWHREGRHGDLERVYEKPYNRPAPTKIPAGRIELLLGTNAALQGSGLDLATAESRVRFADGTEVGALVHAIEPVGLLRIGRDVSLPGGGLGEPRPGLRLVAPAFGGRVIHAAAGGIGAGDLAQLGYPPPRTSEGTNWQAFEQTGALGFRFAVYLGWVDRPEARWAAWSVASSAEGSDPLQLARDRVRRALRSGYTSLFKSHCRWWDAYWRRAGLRLPNAVVERQWYLETYKFGAASRRGAPPITLQGPWTADDGQLPPWKGDYHHDLNTQLSYWPCYSGNHLEEGLAYLDWLWATRSNCVAWTRKFYELPGLNVPMTADLANRQIGGWRQYTHSPTTAAWLAQHFYLHWRFSADRTFLRDRAYPYLREASVFMEAISNTRDARGRRTLALSASPEIHDNQPKAWFDTLTNYDLALMRWLFGATAELASHLGRVDDARRWRQALEELPELALGEDGRLLVAEGVPLPFSHRHFSHLMAIHPLGLVDVRDGAAARRTVAASLAELERVGTAWWCGYSFSWLGNLAARAGDGVRAERALETFATAFTLRNSFHCNGDQSGRGHSQFTYRPFTLEGNFAMAAGVQEMLLQSHRGRIEVFPAVPPGWADATFVSLRAEGAFLVSAERRGGRVRRVEIVAEQGGRCRLLSPFSGQEEEHTLRRGQRLTLTEGRQ